MTNSNKLLYDRQLTVEAVQKEVEEIILTDELRSGIL
jgi:hypothetical protein